ncbi:MAG: RraA family protein [Deltaproteobacteria bacterium]|jgi:regulator of RNase E activity RraA|nr:RraA family protein [Deltaproteobacteria bacterium]
MAKKFTDSELIELLKQFDTPTISNVVASYPAKTDVCLGLYEPWTSHWYTDSSMKVAYPELGRTVGYAVTAVYGLPDPNFTRLGFADVLRALGETPKPAVVCIQQDFPEELKRKNGLAGGLMINAMKSAGAVAMITDGPSRDINEIRGMNFQYMMAGSAAGHGNLGVKAVSVPVRLAGMDVAPGEIIHMDENGALKFPAKYLREVYERAVLITKQEDEKIKAMAATRDVEELIRIMAGKGSKY